MNYSRNFERDFAFYQNVITKFSFSGISNNAVISRFCLTEDIDGISTKEAFYRLDSTGRCGSCIDVNGVVALLQTKKSVNLHCKMWAEGLKDYSITKDELFTYLESLDAPNWVYDSITNQRYK